jgi:glutamate/tyrosine decarboxylase-like PLP-dependent enzyme
MEHNSNQQFEETLDPQDWERTRQLAHAMVDDLIDYLRNIRQYPTWQHMPEDAKDHFKAPLPNDPQALSDIYQEFLEFVLPYPVGNIHPRFWGWVFGTGTIGGALAEFLAAAMNTNAGDLDHHSANHVERQVLDWCKELLDYPKEASGLLTSGCSSANLIALAVARNHKAGFDIRRNGLFSASNRLTLYTSQEAHSSIRKAVEFLGLGNNSLHIIPVNNQYQIDLTALQTAIDEDRLAGNQPICVIGSAGTTNTGAFDDLLGLSGICQKEGLWLHVDAAFGAWAKLVPAYHHLAEGLELADSLALDLHKWMYMPYEIGCLLIRHPQAHREAFTYTPTYLEPTGEGGGLTGGDLPWLTDLGFQLSRRFNALKAWMSIKEHGVDKYARLIEKNINQAQYLVELIETSPELELCAPAPLNVVNFRFYKAYLSNNELNELNKHILIELQESGTAVVSSTTLQEKFVLHLAITNHRSLFDDFDFLVDKVNEIGNSIQKS